MNQSELDGIKRKIGYFATLEQKYELLKWLKADIKDTKDFQKGR